MHIIDYIFNLGGNFSVQISGMSETTGKFNAEIKRTHGLIDAFTASMAKFNIVSVGVGNLSRTFAELTKIGITLDSQMHDLSAVAGVMGDTLQQFEGYARASAKTFGTDAAVAVEDTATNYQTLRVDALSDDDYDLVSYEIRNKSC